MCVAVGYTSLTIRQCLNFDDGLSQRDSQTVGFVSLLVLSSAQSRTESVHSVTLTVLTGKVCRCVSDQL